MAYGLFTSATDPDNLTKFKDRTVSTMIHNKKGISENKVFIKKDINELVQSENMLSVVNAGMQTSAAISG